MATGETSIPTGGNGARVEVGTDTTPMRATTLAVRLGGDRVQVPLTPADAWKVARELLRALGDAAERDAAVGEPFGLPRSAWAAIDLVD